MAANSLVPQPWKFFRSGGLDQVLLESGRDLWALRHLDQKLWVALGCPVKGLELDDKTLSLIDTDGDGRIRAPELIDAVEWAAARLKDPGELLKGSDSLPIDAIDEATPEGKAIAATARRILKGLGRRETETIMVAEAADPSGFGRIATQDIAIFGEATAAAVEAVQSLRAKVDDYFARCRLVAFDPRAAAALNRAEADFAVLAAKELKRTDAEVAGFPLAQITANRPLPLVAGINPAWADGLAALRAKAVVPLFGEAKMELTEEDWNTLNSAIRPYETWLDGRTVSDLEKLARYHRDLRLLLNNFVNFADFYAHDRKAIFQAGTLYLDGRSADLCIRVEGPNPLAAMSKACIAYCQCTRKGAQAMMIAACFTQGDSDYLFIGRHGVFYDRQGRDWDAVITSLVENPISIREAVFSPYKKLVRFIDEMIAKRAAAADPASLIAATKKIDVGTVAAIGVACGAIGTFLSALAGRAMEIYVHGFWTIVGALIGVLLVISAPSVLVAWLKLRQRTLGPLLDASGWAINGRVAINTPLGKALTHLAVLPPGADHLRVDPYEDKEAASHRRRFFALVVLSVLAALAWRYRHAWLPILLQKLG